jgi:hypothetical protein
MAGETMFLIRAAGYERGDDCVWWGRDRSGYTRNLDEAGRYTRNEAERQQRARPDIDVAVDEAKAIELVRRVVPRDRLAWTAPPKPVVARLPQRCVKCGRLRKHDANPYEPCDLCIEKQQEQDRRALAIGRMVIRETSNEA